MMTALFASNAPNFKQTFLQIESSRRNTVFTIGDYKTEIQKVHQFYHIGSYFSSYRNIKTPSDLVGTCKIV